MWYPQILNMMSEYSKVFPRNEVTMCKSILFVNNTEDDHVSVRNHIVLFVVFLRSKRRKYTIPFEKKLYIIQKLIY